MAISLIKISRWLGETPDLGTCCTSNKINKWSLYKPINNISNTTLTDADYYDANFGYNLFTRSTPHQMVYSLQNQNSSTLWKYNDRTAPYRLTDFDGYVHGASNPFMLEFVNGNSGTANTSLKITCAYDLNNFIQRWKYFEGVRSYADVVAVFYKKGTMYDDTANRGIYVYKIASRVDDDIDSDKLSFIIPNISVDTYELRICITTATTGWTTGEWYNITDATTITGEWYALPPESTLTFNVNSSGGGGGGGGDQPSTDFFNYIDWTFSNLNYDWNEPYLSNINFRTRVMINESRETVRVSADLYYDNSARGPILIRSFSRTLDMQDIIYSYIDINYNDTITTMTGARLDDGILSIRIVGRITINGTMQTKTWNVNIEQ